jgi:Fic family protein
MKNPKKPPSFSSLWDSLAKNLDRLQMVFQADVEGPLGGKYLHWDRLQYYSPPADLTQEEWWLGLKLNRRARSKPLALCDSEGRAFSYALADPIPEVLRDIDLGAGGFIKMPEQITNPETKDQYYVNSLIQEAITSSQLEGAATTREVAKEMIRTARPPHDKSEQMILNNFRTMQRIGALKNRALSKEVVLEVHRIITERTLDDDSAAGRLRHADEEIVVADMYNEVFHRPPSAGQLDERMAAMCEFANGNTPKEFVHPVLRSIILHFWLAYDHPFVDGNGRVARALFYWSMLRHGYWLFEFISISQIILKAPAQYGRAFLYTETDDNDLTYFLIQQLEVIRRAMKELHDYIERKTTALQAVESRLRGMRELNHRQQALINHALRHPHQRYTFKSHQMSHNVVYQTARTDLFDLENKRLLSSQKVGRTWYFTPAPDLEERLSKLS